MNIGLARGIVAFEPTDGNWLALDSLFDEVFSSKEAQLY
jgi:hypothetical protein